ncbi:uncharacterized protein LOC133293612 [Gastrolobium bilobum]|uniref:uncharacterized protein LOC133293612 n=1 Tax=Gastrolobium bilobum TaxID=150636 RepID=UPI002AB105EC|nr:uncharacterized protein LOC133293612 [Gastrolobium bilobum]
MHIPKEHLLHGCSDLIGFAGECVQPKGTFEIWVTFGNMPLAQTIKVKFYVIEYASTYNIILGRPTIAALKGIISMPHLLMKLHNKSGIVVAIRGDQKIARSCYNTSLRAKTPVQPDDKGKASVNMTDLDMREDMRDTRPQPDGELEDFQIGPLPENTTKIGQNLPEAEKSALITVLQNNKDLFAWTAADMPGIDPEKKPNEKWRMCTDYTDLNKHCPKDFYPLPTIDKLVNNSGGYQILSFMDAYSGYNQIPMFTPDEEATSFIIEKATYYYNMMPFGLKNAGATYQRMMNKVFSQ